MHKAVFLDKDGTLIKDVPYNVNPQLIELQHNAIEGLQILQSAGYQFIVITNQSGIARGIFAESDLPPVWDKLATLVAGAGIHFSGFYYCPNHPDGIIEQYKTACNFRKPMSGMLLQAASEHHIDLNQSWMIGDILHDVEAGKRAGCKSILINNGGETEWVTDQKYREPDYIAADIKEAALYIISYTKADNGKQPY